VPGELLLALCMAESGLNPHAWREGDWPDVSGGLTQITVSLAAAYGVGDGSNTWQNKANVRAELSSRAVALDIGARYLAGCLAAANGDWLMALRRYNGGGYGLTADYAERYASHIATYQRALDWAHEALGRA
jgi:hypothetical protein